MFNALIHLVLEGKMDKRKCHDKVGVLAISGVSNSQEGLVCLFDQNVSILRMVTKDEHGHL